MCELGVGIMRCSEGVGYFFDCRGDHRDLPSFPTRRSSDLEYQRMRDAAKAIIREIGVETGGSNIQFARSEEHTSELQSRFDLVCRLLLEKKNRFGGQWIQQTAPDYCDL